MNTFPTVSLMISTYNWIQALELCLKSIGEQLYLPNEVIIADDGSRSDTEALIKSFQANFPVPIIHVWHEDDGFRKSIIMNKAVKASNCDYLIMTDGDIILEKHFVKDHLSVAQKGYFIQGSRALLSEKKTEVILNNTKQIKFGAFEKGILNHYNAFRIPFISRLLKSDPFDSRTVKGCNMSLWKSDFIKANGYNNLIKGWGHEDIELAARLVNNGVKRVKLKFKATCYHIHHKLQSRNDESRNFNYYNYAIENKITYCESGYEQV